MSQIAVTGLQVDGGTEVNLPLRSPRHAENENLGSRGHLIEFSVGEQPALPCLVYVPENGAAPKRLLVSVHGISRNRAEHLDVLCPEAERYRVALLLPLFNRQDYCDYQRLGRKGYGPRADLALLKAIEQVSDLLGVDTDSVDLFGFSGGAQFAQRFALLHPERVARLGLGAAGWYSWPDERYRYPLGVGETSVMPNEKFHLESLLRIPITVWVGERDNERDTALNTSKRVDRVQGRTRRQRAVNWVQAMRKAALRYAFKSQVQLQLLPATGHSFKGAAQRAGLAHRLFMSFYGPDCEGKKYETNRHSVDISGKYRDVCECSAGRLAPRNNRSLF